MPDRGSVDATYNGDGLRTKKNDTRAGALQQHDYTWSPFGLLFDSNPTTTYTPGFGQRLNGIDSFYHVDWLGSTRYVTSANGNAWTAAQSYEAYGKRDAQGMGSPNHPADFLFAGGVGGARRR